ncbi:unnamed protein product [Diatraea saccharalis]|uniref:Uncharacterized protein n=1 Tax=Diatraea saccharalis TaxID=40085 RepID=A0A9N9WDS0_9NEOP|nr:unnamed protein product [Diatraea saccharalis]
MWYLVFIIFISIKLCTPQIRYVETPDISYQIAGIFESMVQTESCAFNESMRYRSLGAYRLNPILLKPSRTDSYSIWKELCANPTIRPIAVVGPLPPLSDGAIRDQCAAANIPHIHASWQIEEPDFYPSSEEITEDENADAENVEEEEEDENDEEAEQSDFKKMSINFYPDFEEIALAYAKLLKYYGWENFAALYEDDFGLLRIQKILAEHSTNHVITVRKLDPNMDNRHVFKELTKYQGNRILIDCDASRIMKYMNDSKALNMVNHYQHYILVTIEAYIVAEQLTEFNSNITWLSLSNYDTLRNPQHYLASRVGSWSYPATSSPLVTNFQTGALLMDDIAKHLLKALQSIEGSIQKPRSNICASDSEPWRYGAALQNAILQTNSSGATGTIVFDEFGRRTNYTLYVNEIYISKRQTIGTWESVNGTQINENRPTDENSISNQQSKHFIVISRKAKPYFYDKQKCEGEDCEEDDGEKYEGFSVDLVKHIFAILREEKFNYSYSFLHEEDKLWGKLDPKTKKWNGLIGDLLDQKADLAVCDLTITEERKKVVDFSVPFMSLGISILYTQKKEPDPELFSFLNPYSFDVWIHTATAYCVVSIVLFVCARISPADWENPQPCDKDPEELENIWNFKNCTWLTMGSIMTQGCDILPKALGSRWVCSMWWFFAMIVCQTYIAQLSASMTSALEDEPIHSVEDLAKQNKILYGAIASGSTMEFFKSSKDKMYRKIYDNMMANPVVLVDSNDEGEKRVLNGKNKYAFFMESCTIDYKLKRNCDLTKVGGELDSKDYGIAMPANSPFRSHINKAILKLKEHTILDEIKTKWWDTKYGAIKCPPKTDDSSVEGSLGMENLFGAFLVLMVGQVFCLFIAAAEFLNECRNIVVREQVTHKEVIIKELKASLNFFQLQKPVLRNPSRAPSRAASMNSETKLEKRAAILDNFMDFEKMMQ